MNYLQSRLLEPKQQLQKFLETPTKNLCQQQAPNTTTSEKAQKKKDKIRNVPKRNTVPGPKAWCSPRTNQGQQQAPQMGFAMNYKKGSFKQRSIHMV